MDVQRRRESADEMGQPEILNDHSIYTGGGDRLDEFDSFRKFVGKDQSIEGDVAAHVVRMEVVHHLRELFEREISGAVASIKIG